MKYCRKQTHGTQHTVIQLRFATAIGYEAISSKKIHGGSQKQAFQSLLTVVSYKTYLIPLALNVTVHTKCHYRSSLVTRGFLGVFTQAYST